MDATILAFGDSLTYGTGADTGESYPAQLQELTGRKVVNAGIPGEVSADGLARLPNVLDETQPRLLILCHGANDLLRALGEQQAAENVRAMVELARARGVDVVLVGVPKFGLLLSPPEFYPRLAEDLRIPYEGGVLRSIVTSNELKSDEVHPNAQGYRKFAETLAELLRESGAI